MYVYILSEKASKDNNYHNLYTVGHYLPDGKFESDTDHTDKEVAAARVAYLNGGGPLKKENSLVDLIVILKFKIDTESSGHPARWNWPNLLDLGIGESVEVVETIPPLRGTK